MQGHRVLIYSQMTRMIDLLEVSCFDCSLVMLIHRALRQSLRNILRKQSSRCCIQWCFFFVSNFRKFVLFLRFISWAVSSKVRIIIFRWVCSKHEMAK